MSRRVSDRAAAAIRPRVSGKVTRRTRWPSLVTEGIRTVPRAGLDLDPSIAAGPARGRGTCHPVMMARHLSGHEIGVGATARIARPAPLSQGVAVLGRMLATMSDGRATSANEYPIVPSPAERLTGRALGIDIGGTSVKAAVVDLASGQLVTERIRELTPSPATPEALLGVVVDVVRRLEATGVLTPGIPGGAGFPSVIRAGQAMTATQLDRSWIGAPVQEMLGQRLRRPMVVLNDADAAGVGEMALGAGQGQSGVVLLLALGTGIGSALFIDGQLVPN